MIHYAVRLDSPRILQFLIDAKVPVNSLETLESGNTALHSAVRARTTSDETKAHYAEVLIGAGIDTEIRNKAKKRAIDLAGESKPKIPKTLAVLMAGDKDAAELCSVVSEGKKGWAKTAMKILRQAAKAPHSARTLKIVRWRDGAGRTSLSWAVERDDPSIAEELLRLGAPANTAASDKTPPLHYAAAAHDTDALASRFAKMLLDAGARPLAMAGGMTAADVAQGKGLKSTAALIVDESKRVPDGEDVYGFAGDMGGGIYDQVVGGGAAPPRAPPPHWDCREIDKTDALKKLYKKPVGAFVIRKSAGNVGALTVVNKSAEGGLWHQHIVTAPGGVKVKGSSTVHADLAALVLCYSDPANTGEGRTLPVPLKVLY